MKELRLLTEWADSVINEFNSSNVKTAAKKRNDPIAGEKDIAQQAQTKYAGRDKDQALQLFIADKLEDMEKRDLDQNKVINAQRKENDALRKQLTTLAKEVHDVADAGQADHREIERIRALAGQAKTDIETRRVGRDEVESLLKQVDELKRKPNTDPQMITDLQKKIKEVSEKNVDGEKFKELTDQIQKLKNATSASKEQVDAELKSMRELAAGLRAKKAEASNLKAEMEELLKTDPELLQDNPLIQNQKRAMDMLFGPSEDGNYSIELPPEALDYYEKTGTGVINSLAVAIDDIQDQLVDLPDESEFEKLKTLPGQKELESLKTIPAEVENQKSVNIEQDKELSRQSSINNIQNKLINQLVSGKKPEDTSVNDDGDYGSRSNDYEPDSLNLPMRKDNTSRSSRKYEVRTQFNSSSPRIENLLARKKENGEQKSDQQFASDIKKAKINIGNLTNDVQSYLVNIYDRISPEAAKIQLNKTMNLINPYLVYWSSISGIPVGELGQTGTLSQYINFDKVHSMAAKNEKTNQELPPYDWDSRRDWIRQRDKLMNKNLSNRLPESLSTDLESIADNILGPQYTKYIK